MEYTLIEVLTSESAQFAHAPIDQAIIQTVRSRRIAARVHVYRGIAGAYEDGEFAATSVVDVTDNLPIKIEILLPTAEAEALLPLLDEMVTDGVVLTRPVTVYAHRSRRRLLPRDLRVADIMTANPVSVRAATPAWQAVRMLMAAEFHSLPVVDDAGHVVGILSDEDLVTRAHLPVRPGLLRRLGVEPGEGDPEFAHLAGQQVSAIMTTPVDQVVGTAFVAEALALMVRRSRRTLPVVDATGRLAGICSRRDVLLAAGHWNRTLARWREAGIAPTRAESVGDVMSGAERHVGRTATLAEVGALMIRSGARRVAVVDEGMRLLGIVAEQDLLRALEPHRTGLWAHLLERWAKARRRGALPDLTGLTEPISAASVMTATPVSIYAGDDLGTAARLMAERQIKELPVLDGGGRFAGFLSRQDVMRAMADPATERG